MMDYAQTKGIAVLNAAPYSGGVFAKGSASHKRYVYQEASAETLEPVTRVESICARYGIPPGAAALQFSMRDSRVASTICGISKPERITQTSNGPAIPFRKPPGMSSWPFPPKQAIRRRHGFTARAELDPFPRSR
jgi:hypothetical protein